MSFAIDCCIISERDEFSFELLFEQTASCRTNKSIWAKRLIKRLWTMLTLTYRKNHQCRQFCICNTTQIYWIFSSNRFVKQQSLISWTTSTFSFITSTQSTSVDYWRKCMNIICCEVVVMKLFLRWFNTNWYLSSKILWSLIYRRR
jgi:hypothetical protein